MDARERLHARGHVHGAVPTKSYSIRSEPHLGARSYTHRSVAMQDVTPDKKRRAKSTRSPSDPA